MERLEDRNDLLFLLAINVTPEGAKPRDGSVRSDKRKAVKASEVAVDRGMLMFPGFFYMADRNYGSGGWRVEYCPGGAVMTGISCFQRVAWRHKCPDSFD